ncbi:D-Tyr tRNAtyr deacylase-like domain-containing protein [Gloeopeniophorella convolvens]|nr:D-Tyr tRNAtyr deacylase-like domain-containing protein [Gloeopeniophorella convolvens]
MRAVVQRVLSASVTVDSEVVSQISRGLMVLVGIGADDNASDVEVLAKKILSLRVFSGPSGDMWKASVKEIQGEVLCVSQFTLMANTSKGNKPDFHRAMVRESLLCNAFVLFIREKVRRSITFHVRIVPTADGQTVYVREDQGWEIWSHDER